MTIQLLGKNLEKGVLNGKKLEEVWCGGKKVRPSGMGLKHFVDPTSDADMLNVGFYAKKLQSGHHFHENGYLVIDNTNSRVDGGYISYTFNKSSFMVRARYRIQPSTHYTGASITFGFRLNRPRENNFELRVGAPISFSGDGAVLYTLQNQVVQHIIVEGGIQGNKVWYAGYADQPNNQITEETPKLFYKEVEVPAVGVNMFTIGISTDSYGQKKVGLDRVALYE